MLVPVLNEQEHITASVAAMRRQRFGGRLEFLLVDGGSTDHTRELLAELARADPRVRVLENPLKATPSGLNAGLACARGRWVARMDAHTRFPDDYITQGVERLVSGGTRWVSGPPVPAGSGPVSRAVVLALRTPLGRGGSRKWAATTSSAGGEYELDAGVFAGVWERSTLLEYGGWDEGWLRNQDSELAGRFLARGERLICLPAMAAHYTPRDSIGSLWRQYLQYGEYREKTAVRHPDTMRRSHVLAPGIVITAVAAALAPKQVRRLARAGIALYAAALGAAGGRAWTDAERRPDAVLVPIVLLCMHFAHGAGALRGTLRHGPPLAALAGALGLDEVAARLAPAYQPTFAPSLVTADEPIA